MNGGVRSRAGLVLAVAAVFAACTAGTESFGFDAPPPAATTTTTTTTTTEVPATTVLVAVLPPTTPPEASTTTTATTTATATTTTSTIATTTTQPPPAIDGQGVLVWPPFEPGPGLDGVAALTGLPAEAQRTAQPILAVKIDNFRRGRPQWGIDVADVIFEENVEGVTRFVALFHSRLPGEVGPVRSARTGDLDLLAGMNRPVLAWSGGNPGVTRWVESAAASGVLVDFTALRNGCFRRTGSRSAPHNLVVDPACAVGRSAAAGPARPLWAFAVDAGTAGMGAPDTTFTVPMDGVRVEWTWDATAGLYRRAQDGRAHLAASGAQISATNVVELFVAHGPSPVDARSPDPETVGVGRAVVHRDGIAIAGVWVRPSPSDPFEFFELVRGRAIPLHPGTTFVELVRNT